ncbi:MAG: PAS domain-containing protein [Bacteroidota bacterium]
MGKIKQDLQILEAYQRQFGWSISLPELLTNPYDAIVLTDSRVSIKWVSAGFTQMTGYRKNEVLDKNPKMFQGRKTSQKTRSRIRTKLDGQRTFVEEVINYRKSGEEYICRVEIHPLFSGNAEASHFIALESEVR